MTMGMIVVGGVLLFCGIVFLVAYLNEIKNEHERRIGFLEKTVGAKDGGSIVNGNLLETIKKLENKKDVMLAGFFKENITPSYNIDVYRDTPIFKPTSEVVRLILDHFNLKLIRTDATPEKYEIKEERPILSANKIKEDIDIWGHSSVGEKPHCKKKGGR